jgi:hypothetical protein
MRRLQFGIAMQFEGQNGLAITPSPK